MVMDQVCWYECEPQMFGDKEACLESQDECWAGTSLNVYSIVDAVL